MCSVAQLCLTLCSPTPQSSRLLYGWNFPGKHTAEDDISYSRGCFRLGLNPFLLCLLRWVGAGRQMLYHECHLGSPIPGYAQEKFQLKCVLIDRLFRVPINDPIHFLFNQKFLNLVSHNVPKFVHTITQSE